MIPQFKTSEFTMLYNAFYDSLWLGNNDYLNEIDALFPDNVKYDVTNSDWWCNIEMHMINNNLLEPIQNLLFLYLLTKKEIKS